MTALAWFMSGLGAGAALAALGLIALDILYVASQEPTISHKLLVIGFRHPVVAALLGAVLGIVLGAFLGHFFFPQSV